MKLTPVEAKVRAERINGVRAASVCKVRGTDVLVISCQSVTGKRRSAEIDAVEGVIDARSVGTALSTMLGARAELEFMSAAKNAARV